MKNTKRAGNTKLAPEQVDEILRLMKNPKARTGVVAKKLGISKASVYRVISKAQEQRDADARRANAEFDAQRAQALAAPEPPKPAPPEPANLTEHLTRAKDAVTIAHMSGPVVILAFDVGKAPLHLVISEVIEFYEKAKSGKW